jgi:YVTN family beta-propeller protein
MELNRPAFPVAQVILGIVVLIACGARADTGSARDQTAESEAGDLVYVSNEDSRNLTVIDARNDSVIATIEVGTRPRGVKVSRDGRRVYVALTGSPKCPPAMPDEACEKLKTDRSQDGVAVVDAVTRKLVAVVPAGSDPETFDVSADGRRLFVSNEDAGSATVVDLSSGRTIATVKVGREPEGVTLSPDGKTFWVTGETDNDITGIDAASGRAFARIATQGKRPRAIGFLPDGSRAYVSNEASGTVSVIVPSSREVRRVIALPDGARPMGITVAPNGTRVYLSTGRGRTMIVIDPVTDSVIAAVHVGRRPWGIGLTRDGRKLYTANGPGNDVTVIETETMRVLRTIPVGSGPWGIALGRKPE